MKPLIIDYLKFNSFGKLKEEHAVNFKPDNDFSKFSLNYDQINSKNDNLLAMQCRGLIVRPKDKIYDENQIVGDVDILAWPMYRFFNHGENIAKNENYEINWSTIRVWEKLDGTMCILYYDNFKSNWCIATRSVPEADLKIDNCENHTFSSLFKYSFEKTISYMNFDDFTNNLSKNHTYIFELTTPLNQIVVDYKDYKVTLIAVRNNITGQELELDYCINNLISVNLPTPKTWNLNSLNSIQNFVELSNFKQLEGVVVVDNNFKRLKIKNTKWVLASRAKDCLSASNRNIIKAIIDNNLDDILPLLDDATKENVLKLKQQFINYANEIDKNVKTLAFHSSKSKNPRKEYALNVKKLNRWLTPYFQMIGKTHSFIHWISCCELTNSKIDAILKDLKKIHE